MSHSSSLAPLHPETDFAYPNHGHLNKQIIKTILPPMHITSLQMRPMAHLAQALAMRSAQGPLLQRLVV